MVAMHYAEHTQHLSKGHSEISGTYWKEIDRHGESRGKTEYALRISGSPAVYPQSLEEFLEGAGNNLPMILLVRDPAATRISTDRSRVRAVLPDDASGPQISAAIEAVAVGLSVFDPATLEHPPSVRSANDLREQLPETLTPREIEVLREMADGLANKEIAARLGVSENTVKFHVASVMGKLGASSRTEAVMLGVRLGIVPI